MKKKKLGLIWVCLGAFPYVVLLVYSLYAAIFGVSACLFQTGYTCDVFYGLKGFGQAWYMTLYVLFPIFLVGLFFIILGLSKTRFTTITRSRLFLTFGLAPFALAILLILFAFLVNPTSSWSYLFTDIFMRHFFIVISELIGIVFILIGMRGLRTVRKKSSKKDAS